MKKRKSRKFGQVCLWLLTFLLLTVGLCLFFGSRVLRMTGLVCLCLGLCPPIYWLLRRLERKHKKLGRGLRVAFTVCLCLGLLAAAVTECFIIAAAQGGQDAACDYVVVLGAGVDGTAPSLSLTERLRAAVDYLQAHPDVTCIVSGGQGGGEDISEAQCMYDWLTAHGIDSQRIWMEDQSTTTQENIRFSLALIGQRAGSTPSQIAVVSSEYHLFRASLMAKALGVTAFGVPARTGLTYLRLNYFLREVGGVWYFLLFG